MTLTVIAGGSTGAERGALQAAIDLGLQIGGWRCAGDDAPPIFASAMRETSGDRGMARRLCIQDSDGTLALSRSIAPLGVVAFVDKASETQGKPFLSVVVGDKMPDEVRGSVADWMRDNDVKRLYITGPAEDDEPGIEAAARRVVRWLFEDVAVEQLGKFIDIVKVLEGKVLEGAVDSDQPVAVTRAEGARLFDDPDPRHAFVRSEPAGCRGEPLVANTPLRIDSPVDYSALQARWLASHGPDEVRCVCQSSAPAERGQCCPIHDLGLKPAQPQTEGDPPA